jgi:probable LLM family oxidoreductase
VELGIGVFGDAGVDPCTGQQTSEAQAIRNIVEAIALADQVGLGFFGVGEHHTAEFPASAAAPILAAAASLTAHIKLASAVTVLSTDDPVRVYQQFSTVDAISRGRAEIIAGRGSSIESFPLFGYSLTDYDRLFHEKLELLTTINREARPHWTGTVRPSLHGEYVPPRAEPGPIPVWLGIGGNPRSAVRAAQMGLPAAFGVLGGSATRGSVLAELYRRSAEQAGNAPEQTLVMVGSPGFLASTDQAARETWWPHWYQFMKSVGEQRGFLPPTRESYDRDTAFGGGLLVGSPTQIADRILDMHAHWQHVRQFIHMDMGALSPRELLASIELLGTKVRPIVEAELGTTSVDELLRRGRPPEASQKTVTDANTSSRWR